jgi:hypothetical protein
MKGFGGSLAHHLDVLLCIQQKCDHSQSTIHNPQSTSLNDKVSKTWIASVNKLTEFMGSDSVKILRWINETGPRIVFHDSDSGRQQVGMICQSPNWGKVASTRKRFGCQNFFWKYP